jgi:hypothetical protein
MKNKQMQQLFMPVQDSQQMLKGEHLLAILHRKMQKCSVQP